MASSNKKDPIRVLHIIESLGTGGMENGVVNLVNRHDPNRVRADVLCLRAKGEFSDRIESSRVHFDPDVGANIGRAVRYVFKTCRRHRYDVVHSHSWSTLIPAVVGSRFARVFRIVHGEHGTLFFETFRRRALQRILLRCVDCCLTVSAALKREIVSTLSLRPEMFRVIRNGVDIDRFLSRREAKRKLRSLLPLEELQLVVGTVGRLVDVKDYATLLRGFASIVDVERKAHLIFIGDGPERESLTKLTVNLNLSDHVSFLGRRDDVNELLPALDVFALTSVHEGMSNTLLEAAAAAVPVVASDIPANSEIVQENVTGFMFKTGDARSLAEVLGNLLHDSALRTRISDNARRYARDNFALGRMVECYEQLYSEMM